MGPMGTQSFENPYTNKQQMLEGYDQKEKPFSLSGVLYVQRTVLPLRGEKIS